MQAMRKAARTVLRLKREVERLTAALEQRRREEEQLEEEVLAARAEVVRTLARRAADEGAWRQAEGRAPH